MKTFILFIIIFVISAKAFCQFSNSITIIPVSPSDTDQIGIIVNASFQNGPETILYDTIYTVGTSTYINVLYQHTPGGPPVTEIDTFFVGTLLCGFNSVFIRIEELVNPLLELDTLSFNVSCTTSIQNFDKENALVFPIPFNDKINIYFDNGEMHKIILYDITSKELLQYSFRNSITINTEELAKGIYIYEISNKDGVIKKGKIIKE